VLLAARVRGGTTKQVAVHVDHLPPSSTTRKSIAADDTNFKNATVARAYVPRWRFGARPPAGPLEVFIRREDAERLVKEVRGDDPEVAAKLRIEERELEAGGVN